jgi:hypothetical protein
MKKFFAAILLTQIVFISATAQSHIRRSHEYLANLYDASVVFDTANVVTRSSSPLMIDTLNAWREWATVDNYSFGKNRGSLPMIADLESLHPYFRDKVMELIRLCKASGISLVVVETYRTPAKQAEYYSMGKKYTRTPGGKSRHQYGLAVDLVPVIDSIPVWSNDRLWKKIGVAGEKLGLRWGGRWHTPYDPAHFEWSDGTSIYQLARGYLPKVPRAKMDSYPCIEEEMKLLKKYWEAWEVEQSVFAKNGPSRSSDHGVSP